MAVKVYIDGIIHERGEARISVFDRGFLYGDSVYEVMRTSGGRPVDLGPHLDRLERSASAIALEVPDRAEVLSAIQGTLAAADNPESYIRVIVTRGGGEIGLDMTLADQPSLIVIVKPLVLLRPEAYAHGIKLAIVGVQRTPRRAMDPGVKSGNYLNNIMALHEARQSGADEAIMCDAQGRIAEGSTSNVFVVRGGQVITPAIHIGLLQGITRERVMDLLRKDGIEVETGALTPEEVYAADEVFITSSIRGVVPVARINDQSLPVPVPGPMTRRIMELYRVYLDSVAAAPSLDP